MALGVAAPTGMAGFSSTLKPGSRGASAHSIANQYHPYGQTASNDYQQGSQFTASNPYAQGAYGQFAPMIQSANAQAAQSAAFAPVVGNYYDAQTGYMKTGNNIAQQQNDLEYGKLDISRGANARDASYYQNLLNINEANKGIAGASFNNQLQQLQDKAATDVRNRNSQATASGGWMAPFRREDIKDVFKGYETGKTAADLQRQSALQGLTEKGFGLEKNKAETGDKNRELDIMAQSLGLNKQKLQNDLEQGMTNLGYDKFIKLDDLLQKASSPYATEAQNAQDVIKQIMAMGSGGVGDSYMKFFGG